MLNLKLLLLFICSCSSSVFSQKDTKIAVFTQKDSVAKRTKALKTLQFNGKDGPYIINDTLYRIDSKNQLIVTPDFNRDSIPVEIDNKEEDVFFLPLRTEYKLMPSTYSMPNKLAVISDIEGEYNAFASFMLSNGIMDKNHNWIYGDGHLVLLGDFMDRGNNVTQVLWLIYKLEHQALSQGGQVHFILGNHEILNLQGYYKYNTVKYVKAAKAISGLSDKDEATKYMYSNASTLGKWLATKNTIEKIGPYVFVHGGLSPETAKFNLSPKAINTIARSALRQRSFKDSKITKFIFSARGPFWYRGLVMDRLNYFKITPKALENILNYYKASKIVVGHTPVPNISTSYGGTVIRTDILHGKQKFTGRTKGLLLTPENEFVIDDLGQRILLD